MARAIDCTLCLIRSWQPGDELNLPRQASDEDVRLNLRDQFPHPYTQADAQQWIELVAGASPETSFAIVVDG